MTSFASSKYKKITYLLTLSAILLPQEALGRNLRVWLLFRANCEAAQRLLHAPRSADLGNTPGARVIRFRIARELSLCNKSVWRPRDKKALCAAWGDLSID